MEAHIVLVSQQRLFIKWLLTECGRKQCGIAMDGYGQVIKNKK